MATSMPETGSTLVLRRTFAAAPDRVFRAWVEPEALERWLRPKGMSMRVRTLEARVGGSFCFDLANGTSIVGTYVEMDPPAKLVFTWTGAAMESSRSTVSLDFLDHGSTTDLILTHSGIDSQHLWTVFTSGWGQMLDALLEIISLPASPTSATPHVSSWPTSTRE